MNNKKNIILLIDDDYNCFIANLLPPAKQFNLQINGFETLEEGINEFQIIQNKVGAILLDLSFTVENYEGLEGLKKIKSINQHVPVIILTGSQSSDDLKMAVTCMQNGAFNYVLKTNFDITSLFEMIKVAIGQYQNAAENERHSKLKEEYVKQISAYEKMLHTSEMIVSDLLKEQVLFPPTIEKRIKEFKSFYNKLLSKEEKEGTIVEPLKRLSDVAGIRVIFYNTYDLDKAISLIESSNDFCSIEGTSVKADDKSTKLGYRAVHFDVKLNPAKRLHLNEYKAIGDTPCEIQFKTIFAHSWSKVYHAFSYKQNSIIKLDTETQKQISESFDEAAKKLEDIEIHINKLCNQYEEVVKKLTAANSNKNIN